MTQPTILQRIKTFSRVETDIPDEEIQRIIDEANAEIVRRYGPHANPLTPITVTVPGGYPTVTLARPIDAMQALTIVDSWRSSFSGTVTATTLTVSDYKVWDDGRTIERLFTGTNPGYRWGNQFRDSFGWGGATGWVDVTYTPVNDGNQREEVIIKLVRLTLDYDPSTRIRMGDVDVFPISYHDERERLLSSLQPRGLLLR